MEKILEVKNLYKRFGKFVAVDKINLEVEAGEILGLLGPNGAGKTTTLQMLTGTMTPTSGEIRYFGKEFWQNRSEVLEHISFSSTYVELPGDLTVSEIFHYSSYLYKISDRKKRVAEVVELFRMKELLKNQFKDLSAGQQTRLNLAKAYLNNPKMLLLDEPTASLDPEVAAYLRDFLLEQQANNKLSILITSHNMGEIDELCDRVVFIKKGKIIANDTPENLTKSMKTSHLELRFFDKKEQVTDFLKNRKFKFKTDGDWLLIDIHELEIGMFLKEMLEQGFTYQDINIRKASLEDYFLEIAKEHEST